MTQPRQRGPLDADWYADQVLPLDGPYPPERVIGAINVIAELVRRLNHATLSVNAREALPAPQDVDQALHGLTPAVQRERQLLHQLVARLRVLQGDVNLASDDGQSAAPYVHVAVEQLMRAASFITGAAQSINTAASQTDHLYLADPVG